MRLAFSLSGVVVASLLLLGNPATGQDKDKEKAAKHDLEKLQGEWKLVRCETDGSKLDIGAAKLVIKEKSYVLHIGPGTDKGTFSLDPLAKPKQWDSRTEGSDETVQAVYGLNGNRLRFAYRFDNKRPTSLFGKRGSDERHVLYVFERGDGKPEKTDDQPKKEIPKIVVAADNFGDTRLAAGNLGPDAPLPRSVGLVHDGGPLGPVGITALALDGDGDVLVVRRAQVFFVRSEVRLLRLELTRNCRQVYASCDADQTCVDGECADDEGELEPWTGELPDRWL